MSLSAADAAIGRQRGALESRTVFIAVLAILVAAAAGVVAQGLLQLIYLITGLTFHGILSTAPQTPMNNNLGLWIIGVPAIGGVIVGLMARYGSRAIRGHGIPEAMEQIILNQSRIPPRLTFLKPLSAAFAIGTGGPFGAEGPIIATGGALGSLVGQLLHTTAVERKTLLAAGAAAGMAATFGSPVSAVLLAIELLLFEYRARSLIPVALASATAASVRFAFDGSGAVFHMPDFVEPGGAALALYALVGATVGVLSVIVTRLVYLIEDGFHRLPIHWMWWPALGGVVVGLIGYFQPRTLGVGYYNISDILSGHLALTALLALAIWKFVSWAVSLGSGTSGGTLAPLFTIGGAAGAVLGVALMRAFPDAGLDVRIAGLVGMAAIFAGASRALLASVVFAFETTLQPLGLLPLLSGCTTAFLISSLLMRNTIMTEKIERRGVRVPADYEPDFLSQQMVRTVTTRSLVTLKVEQTFGEIRDWLATHGPGTSHQGFPVVDGEGALCFVITRRTLFDTSIPDDSSLIEVLQRLPVVIHEDNTLREAADQMVIHSIGRLPVVERGTGRLIGIVTRSDLLGAHWQRLTETRVSVRHLKWGAPAETERVGSAR